MTIPIFYSISDDFTQYAAVSLHSLIKHTNAKNDYTVYFLHQNISQQHQADLAAMATKNIHIKFFRISKRMLAPIQNRQENFLRADFFTLSIFYRLFIPDLFPQYKKAIYLDSDTIVNDDLNKLYQIDLENYLFAACTDSSIQSVKQMLQYIKKVLALKPQKYINSGLLVMNCAAFRRKHFSYHFFDLLDTYHFDCIAPDQDYLNEMGEGQIFYLPQRWDAMPNENTAEIKDPGIIHYNLFFKPWHFRQIQYEKYFWQNARETKFYLSLKRELKAYTDQQRKKERQKLTHMLDKEKKTIKDPFNWANVKQQRQVKI